MVPTRPAFPAPQTRHPPVSTNSLRRLPARCCMSGRGTGLPRPAAGPLKPAHPTGLTTFPALAAGPLKCASGQLTQIHCADEGAWRRFAMRRRRGPRVQARPKAGACGPGRGSPKNLDRLDSTKVRRCGVRAIGSAGRMTDHAGQTRRHAGAWVRSLHFSTLSCIS